MSREAIQGALDAPQPQGEPVAWMYDVNGHLRVEGAQLDYYWMNRAGEYVKGVPLYTAPIAPQPAAAPQGEPVAHGLLMRAAQALEVVSNEWRAHDPQLRIDLSRALAAPQPSDKSKEWRELALKFDAQRMAALAHLKAMLQDPARHADVARQFLAAPPGAPAPQPAAAPLVPLVDEQIERLDWDNCDSLSFAKNQLAFAHAVIAEFCRVNKIGGNP